MSNLLTFSTLNFFPRRFYLAASGMCRAVVDLHNKSEMAMSGPRMRLCFGRLGQPTHHLCGYLHEDRERPTVETMTPKSDHDPLASCALSEMGNARGLLPLHHLQEGVPIIAEQVLLQPSKY